MKRLLAIASTALVALSCSAATIQSFELAKSEQALSVRMSDGRAFTAPQTSGEQEGFSDVQISPDRRFIGWTVTFPNCCTSYPLPRSLVVHDGSQVVRVVSQESLSIFEWHFTEDSRGIILHRELPHGISPHLFQWIRIADGKLVNKFDCDPIDPDHPPTKPLLRPPKWTGANDIECDP